MLSVSMIALRVNLKTPAKFKDTKLCRNWLECYGVPLGLVLLVMGMWAVFFLVILPVHSPENKKFDLFAKYQVLAVISGVCVSLLVLTPAILIRSQPGNRGVAFLMSFVAGVSFVIILAFHAGIAVMLGAWLPYTHDTVESNNTISASLDSMGGMVSALLGLVFVSASLPIVEVYMYENDSEKHFSWGRSARVLLSAAAAIGTYFVALSPMKSANMTGQVSEELIAKWDHLHRVFAAIAFLLLFLYEVAATWDSCNSTQGRKCNFFDYFPVALGGVGLTTIILTQTVMTDKVLVSQLFPLGEYLMALSFPLTAIHRFGLADMAGVKAALVGGHDEDQNHPENNS